MKLYSWNVNGIRATSGKPGFWPWFTGHKADLIAFQETKAKPDQLGPELLNPNDYLSYWSSPLLKKGYSGVVTYSLQTPIKVSTELPDEKWSQEGRLIHLELPSFHFLNVYFPNGQRDQERLDFKLGYYDAFLKWAEELRRTKPIVVCGDFNTAHKPVDLARPKENEETSGFLPIERAWLDKFVEAGYLDSFRLINGDAANHYSWWSFRAGARKRNVGWRIDYFFISQELKPYLKGAWLEPEVTGSDHCPIGLELIF